MNAIALAPQSLDLPAALDFERVAAAALAGLPSVNSQRVYGQTYRAWASWAADNGLGALDLLPGNVALFLTAAPTSKATRQRQLSALRRLAQKAHTLALLTDPEVARKFEALRALLADVKAPAPVEPVEARDGVALAARDANKLLRVWAALDRAPTLADMRNRALVALLLATGLRRSEAAGLRWAQVDFDNGVIVGLVGKGDKRRDVAIVGDFALEALADWQLAQPGGYAHVFTPLERGNRPGADRPLSGTDIYRIMQATATAAGVAFKPHDLRRTFITEALANGTPVQQVQAQAGHARGDTTLSYARAIDARRARKTIKLGYGL